MDQFECDECLGDRATSSGYEGVTLAYAISVLEGEVITLCNYAVTPFVTDGSNKDARETRAYREMLRSRGKKVPKISENALRDELVILPGAAMSPADVVRALEKFIEHVEKDGMYIGKYKDDFIREKTAGEPRFVRC
ncbi:MAG: hypothetical protein JHD07_02385 [Bradyrhizobium sp.]|uniref:hypothetical protein n=1 Tax=Bradyrhizobium sp. TaxID=376 RepID=UPI001A2FF302|nr:hypothetical protein [Bradyrhizobium sp.]MBJ7402194.1 hypothetical protein [Bradyrhizobium sp.]